jgi:hypothetical protein
MAGENMSIESSIVAAAFNPAGAGSLFPTFAPYNARVEVDDPIVPSGTAGLNQTSLVSTLKARIYCTLRNCPEAGGARQGLIEVSTSVTSVQSAIDFRGQAQGLALAALLAQVQTQHG